MTASLDLADPNTDPFEVAAAAAAVIAERTGAERHDGWITGRRRAKLLHSIAIVATL